MQKVFLTAEVFTHSQSNPSTGKTDSSFCIIGHNCCHSSSEVTITGLIPSRWSEDRIRAGSVVWQCTVWNSSFTTCGGCMHVHSTAVTSVDFSSRLCKDSAAFWMEGNLFLFVRYTRHMSSPPKVAPSTAVTTAVKGPRWDMLTCNDPNQSEVQT